MMKNFAVLVLALAFALPLTAQNWSVGVGTGPFVFGDFLEREVRISGPGGGPSAVSKNVLSAGTRAGASVDLERRINDRWAVRLEGTFTNAPLRLDISGGGDGSELDAGDLDVTTFMLPLVFRINRNGAFRFHVMAGPAMAVYRSNAPASSQPVFEDTQQEWGVAYGGGVGWWLSDRFAIEGNLTDITTTSPFDEDEFSGTADVEIPRPHNVHTTIGVRWVF